jgi:hypothetical protein
MRNDPPPAVNSMEPRYLRPLKAMVAPPEKAESDDPCVVPVRGLFDALVASGSVGSPDPDPVPFADDGGAVAAGVPLDSTEVAIGTAPSGPGVAPFVAPFVTPAAPTLGAVAAGIVGTGLTGTGLIGASTETAVTTGGFVGALTLEGVNGVEGVGVVADDAGTVTTEETMGESAWKRSSALTISFCVVEAGSPSSNPSPLAGEESRSAGLLWIGPKATNIERSWESEDEAKLSARFAGSPRVTVATPMPDGVTSGVVELFPGRADWPVSVDCPAGVVGPGTLSTSPAEEEPVSTLATTSPPEARTETDPPAGTRSSPMVPPLGNPSCADPPPPSGTRTVPPRLAMTVPGKNRRSISVALRPARPIQ